MDLLYAVMDQTLVDTTGRRCGRVDDLVVEEGFERPARVLAVLSGGGAQSVHGWRWLHRVVRWALGHVGLGQPVQPARVAWEQVHRIARDVYLKRTAHELGLNRLNEIVAERLIGRIPGGQA
jgi:hypothetical protein